MLFHNFFYKKLYKCMAYLLAASIIFMALPLTAFAALSVSLTASPAFPDSDTQVVLEWNPAAGAQMYEILRNSGGSFAVIKTIDPDAVLEPTTYTDTGLTPETTYTYRLRAFLDIGMQNEIALSYNQTTVSTARMVSPGGLSAIYNINTEAVALSWETASLAAIGCTVRDDSGAGAVVTSAVYGTKTITFAMTDINPADYVVISDDGAGGHVSDASVPITVTPLVPPAVTAGITNGILTISWGNFTQISDFELQRSKWNGSAWSSWQTINISLAGPSTTDIPNSGGTYRYRLSAKSSSNYSGCSNASGNVVWPKSPSNLVCTIFNSGRIDLSWTNDSGNECSIRVTRKGSGNTYTQLAVLDKSSTSYSDYIPVTLGSTYTYQVYALQTSDYLSGGTASASVTAEIPPAPTNLTMVADSKADITLNWQDNSGSEKEFVIERKTDSGSFSKVDTVSANKTSYTDDTIAEDHSYAYRIQASNSLGASAYTNTVSVTVNNIVAPNALTATAVSASQIDLAWSYPGNGSYSTVIERKTGSNGAWTVINTASASTYTYSNSGLTANTQYFYRVRKLMETGITTSSYPANGTGMGAYTKLGGLALSGEAASDGRIRLYWSGTSDGSDVVVERKMANGSFSTLAAVNSSVNEWYDTTGLIPGASYTYRIKTRNSLNESAYSSELTVENVYLEAPTDLAAHPDSNNQIVLSWKDNSDGETGFEIWRRMYVSGSYALYAKVGRNITKYTDTSAQQGEQYYYRVRACLSPGDLYSDYTPSESAGLGIIDPPDDLEADYVSDTSVRLTWDDNSNDESGFGIERRIGLDGDWEEAATVSRSTESYKYTGLSPNIKFFFRIRAYNNTGSFDSYSNEIEVATGKPDAPSSVSAGSISSFEAKITWRDNSVNETGFKVQRAYAGSSDFRTVERVGNDVTSCIDSGLSSKTQYSYRVVAYNDSGESESASYDVMTGAYVTFTDVAPGYWASEAILNLAGRGIIKGKTATRFKPGDTITRAEFTALMIRAFNLETAPVGSFADVKIGKWYYTEVMIAENLGIINGDSGNRFYPDRMITREEMAVIIVKTLTVAGKPLYAHSNDVLEKFWDRDLISPYALSSIASVVGEGVMTGLPGNALAPRKTLTRAEAAAIIYRVIDR